MRRHFFLFFFLTAGIAGAFALCNYALVYLAGEQLPYETIARLQQENHAVLYAPVFNNDELSYKLALYRLRRPDVLVAGSSRALQFPESFFRGSSVNCGRAITTMNTAVSFFRQLGEGPLPRLVLVVLDYWWFSRDYAPDSSRQAQKLTSGTERTPDMFFLPLYYLARGKYGLGGLLDHSPVLTGTPAAGPQRIGLQAIGQGGGFRYDGSLQERAAAGQSTDWRKEVERFRGKSVAFTSGARLYPRPVDRFFEEIARLRERGVAVVCVFPPVTAAFYEELQGNPQLRYAQEVMDYAEKYGAENLTDPARCGITDGQFIDIVHTRPEANAKLLLFLAEKNAAIRENICYERLQDAINGVGGQENLSER